MCDHKEKMYNFYFHINNANCKSYVTIMKRCKDCGFLMDQSKLSDLSQDMLKGIYNLIKRKKNDECSSVSNKQG
jgi:hypothetical protein